MRSDCDLGLGVWYHDFVGECGREVAGCHPQRSDRGADDQRPVCEDGQRKIGVSEAEVVPRENRLFVHDVGTGGDGTDVVRCFAGQGERGVHHRQQLDFETLYNKRVYFQ